MTWYNWEALLSGVTPFCSILFASGDSNLDSKLFGQILKYVQREGSFKCGRISLVRLTKFKFGDLGIDV